MQGYDQEICQTRFFVGLRIEVDAPGILAAIRPWLLPLLPGSRKGVQDGKVSPSVCPSDDLERHQTLRSSRRFRRKDRKDEKREGKLFSLYPLVYTVGFK